MINKNIKSLGFELECGIDSNEFLKLEKLVENISNLSFGTDASVMVSYKDEPNVEIRYWSENFDEIKKIGKILWEKIRVSQNGTCGNHIHIKLEDNIKDACLWNNFIFSFLKKYENCYKNNFKYIDRLHNRYCLKNNRNYVYNFLERDNISRYRAINFLSLKEVQKTIEFRIMPYAANYDEWINQIIFVVDFVDGYIEKIKKNGIKKNIKITVGEKNIDKIYYYVCNSIQ